jgi:hypothetical protein
VEERTGDAPGTPEHVEARLTAAFPRAMRLSAGDRVRLAVVPVGSSGVQQIVIDLEIKPADSPAGTGHVTVRLRGYGKEGLIGQKPTRPVTDQAWSAVMSEVS